VGVELMLGDIQSHRLIHIKGWLFLFLGVFSAGLLVAETMDLKLTLLLLISIWSFCRFYYYAFYVIEKYTDANFKYAGIGSFLRYLISRKR